MTVDEKLDNLLRWATVNGVYINNSISFEYLPSRGVSAMIKHDLTEKTGLIRIPRDLAFTHDLAADYFKIDFHGLKTGNEPLQLLLAKLKFDSDDTIVNDVNLSQKFQHFIDLLPSGKEIGTPFFWNLQEQDLLEGTDAHIFLFRNLEKLIHEWSGIVSQLDTTPDICTDLKVFERYARKGKEYLQSSEFNDMVTGDIKSWTSFPAYLWAHNIFTSRAFPHILIDPHIKQQSLAFLLPVLELTNHEEGTKVSWTFENNEVVFSTNEPFFSLKQGCELLNNYGDKPNVDLLLRYGFVLDRNSSDETTVSLIVDAEALEHARQIGVDIPPDAADVGMNFHITDRNPLPSNLVNLFSLLVQLKSERGFPRL
ncbi:unnamed protein product [Ambrosiozyma monospora]|uniref:Unnamed protein product n=1 Tax=Ambrosiozyma monospora TaxID=43982 RepID=A0ACB5TLU9_AMBMO|nr:unnamed protein product [Ambrosiozyma monospora]